MNLKKSLDGDHNRVSETKNCCRYKTFFSHIDIPKLSED